MQKKILVFTNGEKIGDGLIKLPLLYEIKKRFPKSNVIWMTNSGSTVYNNELKNIACNFIDEFFEKANLNPFFWNKISKKYKLNDLNFDYIFDTQKAFIRTLALKRIKCKVFVSNSTSGFFSSKNYKLKTKNKRRKYYLDELFDLLDLIKKDTFNKNFKIPLPQKLEKKLAGVFDQNHNYIGIAPGAGEENKIWNIENFIKIAKYYEKKSYKIVFFLGPNEKNIEQKIKKLFPLAIFPEEKVSDFSNIEIIMASTKFLSAALSNDSGVSHMLSTNYCPLIKLFGPKNSLKFTPNLSNIHTISAEEFESVDINSISCDYVIKKLNCILNYV